MESLKEVEAILAIISSSVDKAELLAEEFLIDFESNDDSVKLLKMNMLMDQIRTIQDALRDY